MIRIRLETRIGAPREACFALSLSVDAHSASMGRSRERAVAGVTKGEMGDGDTVTWNARHFGLPWRMTSRISEYRPPGRFVDEQVSGPFRLWRHEHRFEPVGGGVETLMIDVAEFEAPLGPLGRIAERSVLRRYMTGLLRGRNRWLQGELETRGAHRDPSARSLPSDP